MRFKRLGKTRGYWHKSSTKAEFCPEDRVGRQSFTSKSQSIRKPSKEVDQKLQLSWLSFLVTQHTVSKDQNLSFDFITFLK